MHTCVRANMCVDVYLGHIFMRVCNPGGIPVCMNINVRIHDKHAPCQSVPSVGSAATVNSVVAAEEGPGKASAALPAVRSSSTRGATGPRLVRPQPNLLLPRL